MSEVIPTQPVVVGVGLVDGDEQQVHTLARRQSGTGHLRADADIAQRDGSDPATGAVDGGFLGCGLGLLPRAAAGQRRRDHDARDEPAAERRCACGEEVH